MTNSKARPATFTAAAVRALRAGEKTQFREVIRHPPYTLRVEGHVYGTKNGGLVSVGSDHMLAECPFGAAGDLLFVREPWQAWTEYDRLAPKDIPENPSAILYTADREDMPWDSRHRAAKDMPRWASRLTLRVVWVRVERLQSISMDDAIAEGMRPSWGEVGPRNTRPYLTPVDNYRLLWDSLHGKKAGCSWAANPWVWCVSVEVVTPGESE